MMSELGRLGIGEAIAMDGCFFGIGSGEGTAILSLIVVEVEATGREVPGGTGAASQVFASLRLSLN